MADPRVRSVPTPRDLAAARPAPAPVPVRPAFDRHRWEAAVLDSDSGLDSHARLIALILSHHAGEAGYLPSGRTQEGPVLARRSGMAARLARQAMTRLALEGFLSRPPREKWTHPRPRPVTLTMPAAPPARRVPPSTGGPSCPE